MSTFYIKRNDLLPVLAATLQDTAGAINLTDCTIAFTMRNRASGTVTVSAAAAAIVSAAAGTVTYTWAGTDTDTAGTYDAEWRITTSGGKTLSVPNDSHDAIIITEDLV